MTLRHFSIEWPDDHGPLWMNTSNLLVCLTQHCRNTRFNVADITGDGQCDVQPETAGPLGDKKKSFTDLEVERDALHEALKQEGWPKYEGQTAEDFISAQAAAARAWERHKR